MFGFGWWLGNANSTTCSKVTLRSVTACGRAFTTISKLDEEQAAYRFAGAFLMPADTLWAEIGKHRKSIGWSELFELKQLFGVSVQAIPYRCKELGIFSETLFRRLFTDFERFGWRSPPYEEPNAREGEKPKRFARLTYRALAEGAISESKAAELLGLSVLELNRQMEEPPNVESEAAGN